MMYPAKLSELQYFGFILSEEMRQIEKVWGRELPCSFKSVEGKDQRRTNHKRFPQVVCHIRSLETLRKTENVKSG